MWYASVYGANRREARGATDAAFGFIGTRLSRVKATTKPWLLLASFFQLIEERDCARSASCEPWPLQCFYFSLAVAVWVDAVACSFLR